MELKTVDIKGKPYVEVHERIRVFRQMYHGYKLISEVVQLDNTVCVVLAKIIDPAGKCMFYICI